MEKEKTNNKLLWKIVFWIALFVLLVSLAFGSYILINGYLTPDDYSEYINSNTSSQMELADNPIDFTALRAQNTDIYAWIKIPNTQIDYPVLQSVTEDDGFYLNHGVDKNYKYSGSIYSERKNSTDFSDRNTVLYGHNMRDGSMFQNLHKFKDKEFFEENKYIYIYIPGHILIYEICAAYRYDNRHILNSFNFADDEVFADYLEDVKNPKSMIVNTRDVGLNLNSKLLTLSTCIGNAAYRYLVQGVLINDELTK